MWTDEAMVLRHDDFENGCDTSWGDTCRPGGRWQLSTEAPYSGGSSLLGTGSSGMAVGSTAIDRTATNGATNMRISFRYKSNNVKHAQNVQASYCNKENVWVKVRHLGRDAYYPTNQA